MTTTEIIKQIAKDRGISPEKVEEEMRNAICQAMATKDQQAQALWKQLSPDGKEPSIDRFLEFCVDRLNKRSASYNQEDT